MSTPLVIRGAREADAGALAVLSGELGYPVAQGAMSERLRESARDGSREILVAELGGRVVGWLEWFERSTLESGRAGEISGLVVSKDHRGGGVGRGLVRHAAASALARGLTRLRVRTNEVRAGTHAFYERLGFELVKRQRVYDVPLVPGPNVRDA